MMSAKNHLKMEITHEQFRNDVKIFSPEVLAIITEFRHLPEQKQEDLISELDIKCLHVCMYLKQLQKRFEYERSNTNVAKRYESTVRDGSGS